MSMIEPIGYAVQMEDGPFVGIWRDREIAEKIAAKQLAAHRDRVIPVYGHYPASATDVEWLVDEEVESYTYDDDGCSYLPDDRERVLLKDFAMGLLSRIQDTSPFAGRLAEEMAARKKAEDVAAAWCRDFEALEPELRRMVAYARQCDAEVKMIRKGTPPPPPPPPSRVVREGSILQSLGKRFRGLFSR